MEPSGDGELNQIFMIAKKETSNSTSLLPAPQCTHTLTVWQGIEKEEKCPQKVLLCVILEFRHCRHHQIGVYEP